VNCSFHQGILHAITGPSGSGKSTLLSVLAGLDKPSEGKITIYGDDITSYNMDEYRREHITMIFQGFHLFPLLTALENVSYAMELNKVPVSESKKRAAKLLESVGISDDKHNRYPTNLSGGEQQRVAVARALATGGKVILADEPTGNLDEENGNHIIEILRTLAHEAGYCIILVTHDLEIAGKADRVFRMRDGKLLEGM
jgi:putative ABC transport system ATP-binding protein